MEKLLSMSDEQLKNIINQFHTIYPYLVQRAKDELSEREYNRSIPLCPEQGADDYMYEALNKE